MSVLRALSLGVGVQSSALAHMAAHGLIGPMPDCAIFADTELEPSKIYQQLEFLSSRNVLPFPIYRVTVGNLGERLDQAVAQERSNLIPFFTESPDGRGRLMRGCTRDYKIVPVRRKVRELLGYGPSAHIPKDVKAEVWIAITVDEMIRATPSEVGYIENRFPFLGLPPHDTEETRKTRHQCEAWLRRNEYPVPPRSRCIVCPFTGDAEWRRIREEEPEEWRQAVAADAAIRDGFKGSKQRAFIHDSLKPLGEVEFDRAKASGQGDMLHECKGMCGL